MIVAGPHSSEFSMRHGTNRDYSLPINSAQMRLVFCVAPYEAKSLYLDDSEQLLLQFLTPAIHH